MVLTVATLVMFAINITQIITLDVPLSSNRYWLVLFPALVFAFFLAWAIGFVVLSRDIKLRESDQGFGYSFRDIWHGVRRPRRCRLLCQVWNTQGRVRLHK